MPHFNHVNKRLNMWLVTRDGFFNIVQSDDDGQKGLLTIKARKIEDLEGIQERVRGWEIETSFINDYHYRMKAPRDAVSELIADMVSDIEYPRTKPVLHKQRSAIYFQVWETLSGLQDQWD